MILTIKEMVMILKKVQPMLIGEMKDYTGIKYVNFDYDNRTRGIWRVTFRCWGKEKVFTNTNRPESERRNLFEEINEWLDNEKI